MTVTGSTFDEMSDSWDSSEGDIGVTEINKEIPSHNTHTTQSAPTGLFSKSHNLLNQSLRMKAYDPTLRNKLTRGTQQGKQHPSVQHQFDTLINTGTSWTCDFIFNEAKPNDEKSKNVNLSGYFKENKAYIFPKDYDGESNFDRLVVSLQMVSIIVNEKAYRLSFCEDPFLCAIISDDSNDSVDTCRHKIRMLFQPTYVRFPL